MLNLSRVLGLHRINNNSNKQEKLVIKITMNENEEMVYSLMGLDPVLLLEEAPQYANHNFP